MHPGGGFDNGNEVERRADGAGQAQGQGQGSISEG
jgi:hypothetical protein